jgi:hypothetical protein
MRSARRADHAFDTPKKNPAAIRPGFPRFKDAPIDLPEAFSSEAGTGSR